MILEPNIPTPEQQAVYDDAHNRALRRRAQFFNPSAVREVDESKLSDTGRAYREKFADMNREPTQLEGILGRLSKTIRHAERRQSLSFEIANKVVFEIYKLELNRKNKSVLFGSPQSAVLNNITSYFIGDPEGPYPLHKGLFLYGGYGVGKTFMMRAMQTLCRVAPVPEMDMQIVSTKTLVQAVVDFKESKDKKANPLQQYSQGNLVLDDLGEERQKIVSYSNEEKPIDMLLSERYIAFDRFGHLTHVTTNLGVGDELNALENQIEQIYGSRILDRFYDMFEFVFLPGDSKRG